MNILYSTVNTLRDRYTPTSHASTFRKTGQITPDEFVAAGDYLVFKFPSWSWADADSAARRVPFLPAGKQFLVTRDVPCNRRLDDDFAGDAGREETLVDDGDAAAVATTGGKGHEGDGGADGAGAEDDDEQGWLRTGALASSQALKLRQVRTVDDAGNLGDDDNDDDRIPDMDEESDEEAIIPVQDKGTRRKYTLYIMYSPYYKTPRLYLSGYLATGQPLPPDAMMEDVVGDYKEKTVTLEEFPFFAHPVKMASVHPCKHAPVMKSLLDRADAALKLRRDKLRRQQATAAAAAAGAGVTGLTADLGDLRLDDRNAADQQQQPGPAQPHPHAANDDWEEVQQHDLNNDDDDEVAIRVDQYLVVFLKFMASVTPGIEHDFTMGV